MQPSNIEVVDGQKLDKMLQLRGLAYAIQLKGEGEPDGNSQILEPIKKLMAKFADVFNTSQGLPPRRDCDHHIPLINLHQTVKAQPYGYPFNQKNEIKKQIKEILQAAIIRPIFSPFASPVVLVKKADGSWRLRINYRSLNQNTVKDKFSIPLINDLLDEFHRATIFSKLDLRSGYHQVRVAEEDIAKTAFRTHDGHYEFLIMPFGRSNAPSMFQSHMNNIFRAYLRRFILVFFDDVLFYSKSLEDHLKHLREVFHILKANCLFAKAFKCRFGCEQVEYLSHVISRNGIVVDPKKVVAIESWPLPTNPTTLREF